MAKVSMQITGMEELQAALKTAPELVKLGAAEAVQKTAFAIAQRAKALVPVRTGALKKAITSTAKGTSGRVGLDSSGVGRRRPEIYWRFVEFGARKIPARPFFRPATDAEANEYIERLRRVGRGIERDLSSSSLK